MTGSYFPNKIRMRKNIRFGHIKEEKLGWSNLTHTKLGKNYYTRYRVISSYEGFKIAKTLHADKKYRVALHSRI